MEPDPPLSVLGSTAVSVAACRAVESVRIDAWFHDELACHVVTTAGFPPTLSRGLVAWVAVRTRFLDELVKTTVMDAVVQVVVVGAGLDSRAYRLDLPRDVTVFEVDHSDVLSMKQRLLDDIELFSSCRRLVVIADLVDDDWLALLAVTGWDPTRATLWIVEGLLVYLTHEERTRLLKRLAAASGPASVLGATLSTRTDNLAHPLWHPADAAEPVEWLLECGWRAGVQTMAEASEEFGRPVSPELRTSTKGRLVRATLA
ncbi:MAG TPA: SAM-dependent methyltransferase [Acidothermaceae bacterium]